MAASRIFWWTRCSVFSTFKSSVPTVIAWQGILLGFHPSSRLMLGLLGTLSFLVLISSLCDGGCLFLFLTTLPLFFVQSFDFWDELAPNSFILLSWVFLMRYGCIQFCEDIRWMIWSPHYPGLHEVVFSCPPLLLLLKCLLVIVWGLHQLDLSYSDVIHICLCQCWKINPW